MYFLITGKKRSSKNSPVAEPFPLEKKDTVSLLSKDICPAPSAAALAVPDADTRQLGGCCSPAWSDFSFVHIPNPLFCSFPPPSPRPSSGFAETRAKGAHEGNFRTNS